METPQHIQALYQKFLQRQCTTDELQYLFSYFGTANETELRNLVAHADRYDDDSQADSPQRLAQLTRVHQHITHTIAAQPARIGGKRNKLYRYIASVAALIAMVCAYTLWQYNTPAKLQIFNAPLGKLSMLELPDHSKVVLNAGSKLVYPEKFNNATRTVKLLSGQAFFEVVHQPDRPFTVKANGADVTVLGTSFEVSSYQNEQQANITVSTGKVGVNSKSGQTAVYLLPGERATITKNTGAISKARVQLTDIALWRQNKLKFDNQPLPEVVQHLARKYNVTINIENPALLNQRITMRLNDQPLNDVLSALGFAKHFNYERINERLIIIK